MRTLKNVLKPLRALPALSILLAAGCATLEAPLRSHVDSPVPDVRACALWYVSLDAAVERGGVRDAGAYRLPGFPYARVDRFLASYRAEAAADDAVFAAWMKRLQALDASARAAEIRNLSAAGVEALQVADAGAAVARTAACADVLRAADVQEARHRAQLIERARVPDDYSESRRTAGFYALARIPFFRGVQRWQNSVAETFAQETAGRGVSLARYVPPQGPALPRREAAALLSRGNADVLGIPDFSVAEREALFAAYAPVFEIEVTGDDDRPGALVWQDVATPSVDTSQPMVYRRLAYTRVGGRTLVQLVYTVWFAARPPERAFDLLAGHLDGVVWRVTLAPDGEPLIYDTMHPCGCFHLFFPTPRATPRPAPDADEEWAFVPAVLPPVREEARVQVALATRTHYVTRVRSGEPGAGTTYRFVDEDSLRSLSTPDGRWRSVYDHNGIVPGTGRAERFLFWPMGIRNAGAMRQWGRHATAFVGRRHFDDADLIDRRFSIGP